MQLKFLEMQGFKSFPNKIKLTFDSGITAVVGPNGSGKSNISDAIRWVMGEQSSKSLRGAKMEDVIFDGTKARKAQGFAQVSLTLDNSRRRLPVNSDDVTITRRYFRSGESEYKINGAAVRLKDIHELLMDTGLGRDGYSMVGQGQIDSIISSKSEDRREIFEEAAGISRYRYRKAEAQKKLQQAEDNLVRLRDIFAELEARVEPLRRQAQKAEKFLALSQEKRELEIGLWLDAMDRAKKSLHAQEDQIALITAQMEETQRQLEETERESAQAAEEVQRLTAQMDQLRLTAARMEEDAIKKEGERAVLENTILHNQGTISRITRDMEISTGTERDIDQEIAEKEQAVKEWEKLIVEKDSRLALLLSESEEVQQQMEECGREISTLSAAIGDLTSLLSDRRLQTSTSQSAMEEICARMQVVESQLLETDEQRMLLQRQQAECGENIAFCENRVKELENVLAGCRMKLEGRKKVREEKKSQADQLLLQAGQLTQRAQMLQDLERNMEGYQNSVKRVMRESKRGTLTGIHGPVSQLISVAEPYAVAVETALGGALQNLVTQDEESAKRAIYYLKQEKAGRATFLPLTNTKPYRLQEQGVTDQPEVIDIAANLVQCEEIYRPVLQSLLGRTVVTESLDDAVSLARRYSYRFRIVTLDGQIINAGGSMTGGSRVANAGILSRANEVEKCLRQAKQLEEKQQEKQREFEQAVQQVAKAQAEVTAAQSEITLANEDRIRQEGEAKRIDEQLARTEEIERTLRRERETALDRVERLNRVMEDYKEEEGKMQQTLREQSEALANLKIRREQLSLRREEGQTQLAALRLEMLTAEKDVDAHREAIGVLQRRKGGHAERIEQIRREIDGILDQNRSLEGEIKAREQEAAKLRLEAGESRSQVSRLQRERGEMEGKSNALRRQEREWIARKETLHTELVRLEERRLAMDREYEETAKRLFEEYQLTLREATALDIRLEDLGQAQRRLGEIKNRIREMGSVNVSAVEEYKEVAMRYEFMSRQIADVERSKNEIARLIEELTQTMSEQFLECFLRINQRFNETFSQLFGGGQAKLILQNEEDVLSSPIDIHIQPPGKNVKNISLFSGGEKALSAIALLFAILKENPAPFCVFDEIEAALDDVNVDRYAQYLRRMCDKTQFIAITHRRGTMEEADVLYGVTMQEKGVSTLLELKTAQMAEELKLSK